MSSAYDIASYVAVTLAKGTLGSTVMVNIRPDQPDNLIAVFEYGGRPSDSGMGNPDSDALENVNVQIVVRNKDASVAHSTAYSIYKSLDGLGGVTINSTEYLFMRALQPPFLLSRDSSGAQPVGAGNRAAFAFNLEIEKRRTT